MTLPTVFPIFPLEVILIPGAMLPLHIFEPRYRAMVADALEGSRAIAVAMPDPDGESIDAETPRVHPVCGLGRIIHFQPHADGRSDIILEGLSRMQIDEELTTGKPYRVVQASLLEETEPPEDVTERARGLLGRLRWLDADEQQAVANLRIGRLLDSMLLRIPLPAPLKHEIFAVMNLGDRLAALEAAMTRLEAPPRSVRFDPEDPRLN